MAGGKQLQNEAASSARTNSLGKMFPMQNIPKFVDCDHRNLEDVMKECTLGIKKE